MGWKRNYGAMGDDKLKHTYYDLLNRVKESQAIRTIELKGASYEENFSACQQVMAQRGMLGKIKKCSICDQDKLVMHDDYVCIDCRSSYDRVRC
jgi:hypothetical protein